MHIRSTWSKKVQVKRLKSDPPGPFVVACFFVFRKDVRMDGRTPCVKIMTTYSAAGAWWVKKSDFYFMPRKNLFKDTPLQCSVRKTATVAAALQAGRMTKSPSDRIPPSIRMIFQLSFCNYYKPLLNKASHA